MEIRPEQHYTHADNQFETYKEPLQQLSIIVSHVINSTQKIHKNSITAE